MVALVSEYVSLKPRGVDDFWGCCPFHEEKSPSFHIRPDRGLFKCFGCGKGGDVFRFVEEIEGIGFRDALERLASRTGIELQAADPRERARRQRRSELFRCSALAAEFFSEVLWSETPDGERGRAALVDRGISEETAREFGVGVAPDSWDALTHYARQRKLPRETMVELGLLRPGRRDPNRPYDFFRNRLMFPIRNEQGKVVAFGGRRLNEEDERKYINSPEIPGFYEKRKLLYGFDRARRARPKRLVVVEGYMDVVIPHQAGHPEFVAALGTAFTPEQAKLAARAVEEVVLLFDADEAGTKAMLKALANLVTIEGLGVRVARLPEGMDPDEAVQRDPELLEKALDEADDLVGFVIDQALVGFDRATPAGQERALKAAIKLLARIPTPLRMFREAVVVSKRFGVPEKVLRAELAREEVQVRQEERRDQERSQKRGGFQGRTSSGRAQQGRPGRPQQGRMGSGRPQQGPAGPQGPAPHQPAPFDASGPPPGWGEPEFNEFGEFGPPPASYGEAGFEPPPASYEGGPPAPRPQAPRRPLSGGRTQEREEYLLEAMLGAPAAVSQLIEQGYGPGDFSEGTTQRLAGAIFHLAQRGEFSARDVMQAVEADDERGLCAHLLGRLDDEKHYSRELCELDGMAALRRQRVAQRKREVTRLIGMARDKETKNRLLAELKELHA